MKSKLLFTLALVLALSACGKKPSFVDAPTGQEGPFPRAYPQGGVTPGADDADTASSGNQ